MIWSLLVLLDASMELGYTFWQGAFGKNRKMYLDRAIFKPSIEVITPRLRVLQELDQVFLKPLIKVLKP